MVMVIVNSSRLRRRRGARSRTYSLAPAANEIALHEMGHTAFGLADEYEYFAGCGGEAGHDHHPAVEPTEPNVTVDTNRATIKWRAWSARHRRPDDHQRRLRAVRSAAEPRPRAPSAPSRARTTSTAAPSGRSSTAACGRSAGPSAPCARAASDGAGAVPARQTVGADVVGFGDAGVYVALGNGDGSFGPVRRVIDNFAYSAGGWRIKRHPRFLADVTGDGRADVVGFGDAGVYVALSNGDGSFGPVRRVIDNFAYAAGGWRMEQSSTVPR